jgi:hypothetical protein
LERSALRSIEAKARFARTEPNESASHVITHATLSALSLLLLLLKATKASATQSFAWVVSMCGDHCHQKYVLDAMML